MKKIIVLIILAVSTSVFAQKEVTEGVIKTKMTMTSENPQINSQLALIGDMIMSTYFKGDNSKSEMKNPMAGNNTSIINGNAKKMLVLVDNPFLGKQYKEEEINITKEDLEKVTVTENGEIKTILGYECKGYDVVVYVSGIETKMTVFTTNKITAINQNNVMLGDKSTGFPMYLVSNIQQGGMTLTMTMEVTEVKSEKVDDALFSLAIPEGYTKMKDPKPAGID